MSGVSVTVDSPERLIAVGLRPIDRHPTHARPAIPAARSVVQRLERRVRKRLKAYDTRKRTTMGWRDECCEYRDGKCRLMLHFHRSNSEPIPSPLSLIPGSQLTSEFTVSISALIYPLP